MLYTYLISEGMLYNADFIPGLIKYDYSNCIAPVGLCQTNSVNIISYVTLSSEEHNGMLKYSMLYTLKSNYDNVNILAVEFNDTAQYLLSFCINYIPLF